MEFCNALNEYLMQISFSVSHFGTHKKYRAVCVWVGVKERDSVSHTYTGTCVRTHTHTKLDHA